jgi:hypothetical protein
MFSLGAKTSRQIQRDASKRVRLRQRAGEESRRSVDLLRQNLVRDAAIAGDSIGRIDIENAAESHWHGFRDIAAVYGKCVASRGRSDTRLQIQGADGGDASDRCSEVRLRD